MVVNAPETPVQAEVIFAIESTAVNGAYIQELKTNYIIPTLEYFHGGALEEGAGSGSIYALVTYSTVDAYPGLPVAAQGPFSSPQEVLEAIDKIEFIGGQSESRACIAEALTTVMTCFDDFGRTDLPMHVLLLCCSPPFAAYGGGLAPPGGVAPVEQVARALGERGVNLSVASARRLPALLPLYDAAADHRPPVNYRAKDSRHLVLLRGYTLKERPPSPAPPPVPDIQTDVYNPGRVAPLGRLPAPAPPRAPPPRPAWPRQPIYNNSALLTQLTQPSYPPPSHPGQASIQRLPGMVTPSSSAAPTARNYIWSGVLEWMEKGKAPGDQTKITKHLPCQVSANTKDIEPELKVDTWPNKLLMQLMPKQLISNIGGQYLKDSKSVLFHLHQNEAMDALTKVMVNGYAGCVHFSPMQAPPQCDIKVLILLYTPDKKAYLGFIPNNQATFVDRLRKVIQQQKTLNKQLPPAAGAGPMTNPSMSGQPGMSTQGMPQPGMSQQGMAQPGMSQQGMAQPGMSQQGMSQPGMSQQGMSQPGMSQQGMAQPGMSQPGMSQQGMAQQGMQQSNMSPGMMPGNQGNMMQNQPNMMMQSSMAQQSVGGKGPRNVNQLDGLEAARQHNLEKIQHLQQTLEAAHQQEAQFKSQMDIMGHLQAAQQQEQHYKQLEEQRKHQLQQQLMRGSLPPPHPARLMRPIMPSNPGLKHLLQQQQQIPRGARPM